MHDIVVLENKKDNVRSSQIKKTETEFSELENSCDFIPSSS